MTALRRAAALLLALPVVLAGGAQAAPSPDPVLVDVRGQGSRWTAVTVDVPAGERVTSTFRLLGPTSPAVLSARTYLDGDPLSASTLVLRSAGGDRGVALDSPDVAGVELDVDTTEEQAGSGYAALEVEVVVNPDGPVRKGRLTVVVYGVAPEVNGWEWRVQGAPGAALRGAGDGSQVLVATSRDFRATELSVYAGHTVPDVGTVNARAQRGAELSQALDPRFMGRFSTFGTDTLGIEGPGVARDCSTGCDVDPAASTRLPRGGAYRFRIDGTGVGVTGTPASLVDGDVTLHGALVRPPLGRL